MADEIVDTRFRMLDSIKKPGGSRQTEKEEDKMNSQQNSFIVTSSGEEKKPLNNPKSEGSEHNIYMHFKGGQKSEKESSSEMGTNSYNYNTLKQSGIKKQKQTP